MYLRESEEKKKRKNCSDRTLDFGELAEKLINYCPTANPFRSHIEDRLTLQLRPLSPCPPTFLLSGINKSGEEIIEGEEEGWGEKEIG